MTPLGSKSTDWATGRRQGSGSGGVDFDPIGVKVDRLGDWQTAGFGFSNLLIEPYNRCW